MPFIRASVETIAQLFSGTYRFRLPWFQRAYAWNEGHVGRLIDDMLKASGGPKRRYWLGYVFLAKPGDAPDSSLIDGQQRAITLTMIFAVLRDRMPGTPIASRLHGLVQGEAGWRLVPQPSIAKFFEAYVQQERRTLADPASDMVDLTENELNLLANRDHVRDLVDKLLPDEARRADFATFVLDHCLVTIEIVEDEDEAWSLLSTEEETGLGLHSCERYKLSLVMAMPRGEQEAAGRAFEQAQAIIGSDQMSQLLTHIRILKTRRRSSKPIEKDLLQLFSLNESGLYFLQTELLPRANAMLRLKLRSEKRVEGDAVRDALATLYWLDHQMWMPAALHWMAVRTDSDPETAAFLGKLERLAYVMKIASVDPTDQERRFLKVLDEIVPGQKADGMRQLDIEPALLEAALANLRSTTFYYKRFCAVVLRRISRNMASSIDVDPVDGRFVTVEHVLPKKPEKGGGWSRHFPSQEAVAAHCNRLGNLAFLSLDENHQANNREYREKRPVLLKAASRFPLTAHAAAIEDWTAQAVLDRTEALIEILLKPSQLKILKR